ncbi:MAG: DUF4336 domain-containing protein, partial [Leptolyngbyaceae cyanobacterium SM1_1_3]|nr:DUF4336 domain-containing protein [Leptolyngbyaceae cyanobacterium SM1_1_3]
MAAQPLKSSTDRSWPFWPAVPLYPYGRRRTLRREVVKDTVWTFDQCQGIFYVVVPIRMTVVRLDTGGLLVYAPVAPTQECVGLMQELETAYGQVKYIILPTVSAVEHKVFVGPFARCFSAAQVYVVPNQWSFPLNLPLSWLGFPLGRTVFLPSDSTQTPFADEFDYALLGPINLNLGPYAEVAFFHRRSQTLLVTDAVMSIPHDPPAILQVDPYPLLFHARDQADEAIADTPANRVKGWHRIVLFTFYFRPSVLEVVSLKQTLRAAFSAAERSSKAYFGLYPFRWCSGWPECFETLRGQRRLFVAPILQELIFNRSAQAVLGWADAIAAWPFRQVITCHLDSPTAASPAEFRRAFEFLEKPRLL